MAAPKARGRAAAMQQLAEKQHAETREAISSGGAGGAGLLSPPAGGGGAALPSVPGGKKGPVERTTFAERVGDVKDSAERARQEYRSRATAALGAPPSSGPSVVTSAMHQRFQDLEAAWGEVMDYTKIDPLSGVTPGLNAASAALARNRHGLDEQTNAIISDLWDGVSSGQSRSMTDSRKDDMMNQILRAPGTQGMPLSPNRAGPGGFQAAGGDVRGLGLALQLPDANRAPPPQPGPGQVHFEEGYAPPPLGAQDFETRRQLEILREEMMRLEQQVLQAVEAEEDEIPPPPPLIQKTQSGISSYNRAQAYEDIIRRIQVSEVGAEPDSGGTPCNSSDDPSIPLMMPPKGGLQIRKQIDHLVKETQELKEAVIEEIGGEAAARRMREMTENVKAAKASRQAKRGY